MYLFTNIVDLTLFLKLVLLNREIQPFVVEGFHFTQT